MSTGGDPIPSRGLIVAVTCLAMTASASMINVSGALFGLTRTLAESPLGLATAIGVYGPTLFLFLPLAGVLAGALGLVVVHRAPRDGWVWLLLAGTLQPFALKVPGLTTAMVVAAAGAGSTLMIIGLLGGASWLSHAASRSAGAAVAGVALAAPLLGGLVVFLLPGQRFPVDTLLKVNVALVILTIAAAAGLAVLLPRLRRLPAPPPPTRAVTIVGAIAAGLPWVPNLVLRIGWSGGNFDGWATLVGVCGLAVLAAAIALAAKAGVRVLAAALATGLVLYGVDLPLGLMRSAVQSPSGVAAWTAVGLAVGIAFALSRWRTWLAGAVCGVAGIAVLVLPATPSSAVIGGLLALGVVAAVTTYGATATALADRAQAPAVLGAVAIAIRLGLSLSGALLPNTEVMANPFAPRSLIVAAGIALLAGGLVVLALGRMPAPEPADQAELSPGLAR